MSSLAFSVWPSSPIRPSIFFNRRIRASCAVESDANHSHLSRFNRRLAVGFGVGISLFPVLPTAAAESGGGGECEFRAASSGLEYCDKVVGTGDRPLKGQLIKAHYVGRLEDGEVFDSSYSRGKPLSIRIGVGEVIKGWDEGILGGDGIPAMLAGGKRRLRIPPAMAYGQRGAGCRGGSCIIPPNSTLLFDIEFIGKS